MTTLDLEVSPMQAPAPQRVRMFGIEIDRDYLTENAWAMLDALEAYLAGNLMGLVYAPEDGFYGSGLQLLHKIG